MIDTHIHIGRFHEVWYDPEEIIDIVLEAGIGEITFSSTTSGAENVLYTEIEKELSVVFRHTHHDPKAIKPLLWYIPQYAGQGLTVAAAMAGLPYHGLKLHPRANYWDLENAKTLDLLHELFDYANQHTMPILIHTGYDTPDEANKFSRFFPLYPHAQCILAHCRPLDQTVNLLRTFPNVYCDTAFVEEKVVRYIADLGFASKILPGSDFPITHFYDTSSIGLRERYTHDVERLRLYNNILNETGEL